MGQGAERQPEEPVGPLALEQVLAVVLLGSPELAAFEWDVRAAEARRLYAGQWVNPDVSLDVQDALGTRDFKGLSQAQTTLQLGQVIELGGKRQARHAVAEGAERDALREYDLWRIAVLSEAATRFIHLVGDQARLALGQKARELAQDALAEAQRRVSAGAASSVEERRARVFLARIKIAEQRAERELLSSRRNLAAMWGSTRARFSEAQADLFVRAPVPTLEGLTSRIEKNPELRRLAAEQALRDANVTLAESRGVPDVRLSAGARRLEGPAAVAFLAGVSMPLPLFERNQGEIGASRALRAKLDDERKAARVTLLATLFTQHQDLVRVVEEIEALEGEVLTQAEAMMKATEEGFRLGRFSQLELIDAQRTLVEVRKEHIDAAEKYHSHVVRLEKLIGGPLAAAAKGQENAP